MTVTMVIGGTPGPYVLPTSLFKAGVTLSSLIASEFGDATGLHLSALFGLGLVLFLFALAINIFARVMVWRVFQVTGAIAECIYHLPTGGGLRTDLHSLSDFCA